MTNFIRIVTVAAGAVAIGLAFNNAARASDQHHHGVRHHGHHSDHGHHGRRHTHHFLGHAIGHQIARGAAHTLRHVYGSGHHPAPACHPVSKPGYDHHGRRIRIGGTMCYDRHGEPYVVQGSRYIIGRY
ncbi:MAG: hypothetical protein ACE5EM_00050 [Sphingomonadales bacterium]